MAEKKVQLSKKDRLSVALRSTFLQGSWNYERMQNGGWCFAMIPAIKKLYTTKEDQIAALKRHLEFFNTLFCCLRNCNIFHQHIQSCISYAPPIHIPIHSIQFPTHDS